MEKIAVLGAGAMGSAFTAPIADRGHDVRLWGTWLDDELVAAMRAGEPNPRTKVHVDQRVRLFDASQLEEALDGATLVVLAITSDGVRAVLERAKAAGLPAGAPLAITTKGFGRDTEGRVTLLPGLLAGDLGDPNAPIVAFGGPVKANEVAARRPTATVFAGSTLDAARRWAEPSATPLYGIEVSDDLAGTEVSAAMKNVFAIALGVCQGLGSGGDGEPWHNLQAAVFARAIAEISALTEVLGGRTATASGLPGVGDLEVTGLSGRNKVYGERIGRGEDGQEALQAMKDAGQAVEGVPAAGLAAELVSQRAADGSLDEADFPLLRAVVDIIGGDPDPTARLVAAAIPGNA
jgi:glycerol-3-phosphate dehydrogenase (NAD(P)+)